MRSCPHCETNIANESKVCSNCNKAVPPLPNYPSISPKWFMVFWVFFVVLVVALMVSMFGMR